MDAFMHQHLAVERRDSWIGAAAWREPQADRTARRATARRLRRRPLLRIAR